MSSSKRKSNFQTNQIPLMDYLGDCQIGDIQLPEFQRSWVWKEIDIKNLIASVANAFPIGCIMELETNGNESKTEEDKLNLKSRLIEGVCDTGKPIKPKKLILDGQQRITSLYQVTMRNKAVDVNSGNSKKKSKKRWFYIDMEIALSEAQDITNAVLIVPEDKRFRLSKIDKSERLDLSTPEEEYRNMLFPVSYVFDWDDWQTGFRKYWENQNNDLNPLIFKNFKDRFLENFNHYQVPVITLKSTTSKAAVCAVFEKVNTGGQPLDAFELLTATFAAEKGGCNLRDDWIGDDDLPGRKQRLAEAIDNIDGDLSVFSEIRGTDFLEAISLFHTRQKHIEALKLGKTDKEVPAVSCSRPALLNITLKSYLDFQNQVEDGFIRAAKFLFELKIPYKKYLPYQSQIVSLAAILADLGDQWNQEGHREKIREWYWNGVFGELYGSSVHTRNANDFLEVRSWLNGDDKPRTVKESIFREKRLVELQSTGSAAYKGIFALLMNEGARDFRSGQKIFDTMLFNEKVDLHHVFPVDWCKKRGIKKLVYNSIINKTPVSENTNRTIGAKAPSVYLVELENERTGDTSLDEILSSHLIDRKFLEKDDFDSFFENRKSKLCEIIEKAMRKKVIYENQSGSDEFEVFAME